MSLLLDMLVCREAVRLLQTAQAPWAQCPLAALGGMPVAGLPSSWRFPCLAAPP